MYPPPKGITIFRNIDRSLLAIGSNRWGYRYYAFVKSKGRTGAATRSIFMRASFSNQQRMLADWYFGRATRRD